MKSTTFASTFALSILALCSLGGADSLNVASVISEFYPTSTPKLDGAQSTSLASALYSVQSTWFDSPSYTSANIAIFSAAPSSVQSSISKSGYEYKDITSQPWYTKSVPNAVKSAVAAEISAIDSAAEKVVGTATSTSTGGGARATALGVAGVVGVVGGVLAAL